MNTQFSILELKYNIRFRDADEGDCYAGEGTKLIGVYSSESNVQAIADKFNSIIAQAEKEHIVFPMQKYNRAIKEAFGFTLHDIDNGYDFKLKVSTYQIKEESKPQNLPSEGK